MPKILFIAAHRPERSPSQRYRFEQYFNFLKDHGYELKLSFIINEEDDKIFYGKGHILGKLFITLKSTLKRMNDILKCRKVDIVFVQREAFMMGTIFFEKMFSKTNAKFVYDFDDSIWLLDTSDSNKKWEWLKNPDKTKKIIKISDLIFAGNSYLGDYAKQYNDQVKIVPTTIDTHIFNRKTEYKNNESICIGWSGSHTTIKHFEEAIPILKKIKEKYKNKVYFKVMGDPLYSNLELDIKGIPWSNATETEIIESFDIGIMPLPDDQWVKGKCGLKGLSYMALEVPTIMSNIGVNTEIIIDGINGYLASTEDEWIIKLSQLIDSYELRKQLGSNARKTVQENYSVDSQKNRYLSYFNELLKR